MSRSTDAWIGYGIPVDGDTAEVVDSSYGLLQKLGLTMELNGSEWEASWYLVDALTCQRTDWSVATEITPCLAAPSDFMARARDLFEKYGLSLPEHEPALFSGRLLTVFVTLKFTRTDRIRHRRDDDDMRRTRDGTEPCS